jgi:lysophospholipase L1-like esterase
LVTACIYVALLHVALALVLLKSDFLFRANERLGWSGHLERLADRHFRFTSHTRLDRTDKKISDRQGIVLAGDSIVRDLPDDLAPPNSINLGLGGLRTGDLPRVLVRYPSLNRASSLVVGIGINDLCIDGIETGEFARRIGLLAPAMPDKTRIYWLSITPLAATARSCGITPQMLKQANEEIAKSCAKLQTCHFVDVHASLADDAGYLRREFHDGDGIHLSHAGYERWVATLGTVLQSTAAQPDRPRGNAR